MALYKTKYDFLKETKKETEKSLNNLTLFVEIIDTYETIRNIQISSCILRVLGP